MQSISQLSNSYFSCSFKILQLYSFVCQLVEFELHRLVSCWAQRDPHSGLIVGFSAFIDTRIRIPVVANVGLPIDSSPMANNIEFINLSYPSQGSSSTLRRRAYSHAARVNHARVKLARNSTSKEPDAPPTEKIGAGRTTETKEAPVLLPDPIDPLTSSRRDPFGCFARPLSQFEHYLFDHCTLICGVIRNLLGGSFADPSSLLIVLYCRCNCCHHSVCIPVCDTQGYDFSPWPA